MKTHNTAVTKNSDEQIKQRLKKAKGILAEIDILVENKFWDSTVDRLYFACFHAVVALLADIDIYTHTHDELRQMFNLHFVKTGIVKEATGAFFSTLSDMWQVTEYEALVKYEETDVLPLIAPSGSLIAVAERILNR